MPRRQFDRTLRRVRGALCLVLLGASGGAFAQSTPEELAAGGAAAVVIAQRCNPANEEAVLRYARSEISRRMRAAFTPAEIEAALDGLRMKVNAFSVSSGARRCEDLESMRAMARNWGFAQVLR